MKDRVRENTLELYGLRNLPDKHNPMDFYLSKVEHHSQQSFGENNTLKSYNVLSVVSLIAVIMWRSSYLSKDDCESAPMGETTLSMISNLAQVDFSALKLLPLNHDIYDDPEEEKTIIANKI